MPWNTGLTDIARPGIGPAPMIVILLLLGSALLVFILAFAGKPSPEDREAQRAAVKAERQAIVDELSAIPKPKPDMPHVAWAGGALLAAVPSLPWAVVTRYLGSRYASRSTTDADFGKQSIFEPDHSHFEPDHSHFGSRG